jgi:hypothetical protein
MYELQYVLVKKRVEVMRRLTLILAVCAFLLVVATGARADMITAASDNGSGSEVVTGGFGEGVLAFIDRTYQWVSVPGYSTIADMGLVGADYVKLANNDKTLANYKVDVTFSEDAEVFLFWDERGSVNPWVSALGFTDTGSRVIGVGDGHASIWENIVLTANLSAGTYTFKELNQGVSRNMYGIAVVPVPGAVMLGILGLGVVGVKLRKFA